MPAAYHFLQRKSHIPSQLWSTLSIIFLLRSRPRNANAHRYLSTKHRSALPLIGMYCTFLNRIPSSCITSPTSSSFVRIYFSSSTALRTASLESMKAS